MTSPTSDESQTVALSHPHTVVVVPDKYPRCSRVEATLLLMRRIALALVLALPTIAVAADRYKVSVTRRESNLYQIDATNFWIRTRYCHELSLGDPAIMVWHGKRSYSNKLIFLNFDGTKKSECDIEALLVETEP